MFSRLSRVTFSVMSALALIVTTVIGAEGAVLCIARDHTAVEMAHAGNCSSYPDMPTSETVSPADSYAGLAGRGSCLDIPLSRAMTSLAAPARYSAIPKVLASVTPGNVDSTVRPDFAPADSSCFEGYTDNALGVSSTTILRI